MLRKIFNVKFKTAIEITKLAKLNNKFIRKPYCIIKS